MRLRGTVIGIDWILGQYDQLARRLDDQGWGARDALRLIALLDDVDCVDTTRIQTLAGQSAPPLPPCSRVPSYWQPQNNPPQPEREAADHAAKLERRAAVVAELSQIIRDDRERLTARRARCERLDDLDRDEAPWRTLVDTTHGGEALRRYQVAAEGGIQRSLTLLLKIRKQTGEEQGAGQPPAHDEAPRPRILRADGALQPASAEQDSNSDPDPSTTPPDGPGRAVSLDIQAAEKPGHAGARRAPGGARTKEKAVSNAAAPTEAPAIVRPATAQHAKARGPEVDLSTDDPNRRPDKLREMEAYLRMHAEGAFDTHRDEATGGLQSHRIGMMNDDPAGPSIAQHRDAGPTERPPATVKGKSGVKPESVDRTPVHALTTRPTRNPHSVADVGLDDGQAAGNVSKPPSTHTPASHLRRTDPRQRPDRVTNANHSTAYVQRKQDARTFQPASGRTEASTVSAGPTRVAGREAGSVARNEPNDATHLKQRSFNQNERAQPVAGPRVPDPIGDGHAPDLPRAIPPPS
ncbi:hypothetical protein EP7_002350 [Isosphaeraceae bacterium EP7]